MSQENVEIVRRYATLNGQRHRGILAAVRTDIEIVNTIRTMPGHQAGEDVRRRTSDALGQSPGLQARIECTIGVTRSSPSGLSRDRWRAVTLPLRASPPASRGTSATEGQARSNLARPTTSPRSRRAAGVGDVAGERGDRAALLGEHFPAMPRLEEVMKWVAGFWESEETNRFEFPEADEDGREEIARSHRIPCGLGLRLRCRGRQSSR